jgi:hypothetical protein
MLESASDKKILTIDSCLDSAEALVNSHSYNQALSILKSFDDISDRDKSLAAREKHQKLMLFILERYRRLSILEKEEEKTLELASLYCDFEKYEAAKVILENLHQSKASDPFILHDLLKLRLGLNCDIDDLIDSLSSVNLSDLDLAKQAFILTSAINHLLIRNLEVKAIFFCEKLLEIEPENPSANHLIALFSLKERVNILELENYINFAIQDKLAGESPILMALSLARAKKDCDSEQYYLSRLKTEFPDSAWTYQVKALELIWCGHIEAGLESLEKAVSIDPHHGLIYDQLAMYAHYHPSKTLADHANIASDYYAHIIEPFKRSHGIDFHFNNLYFKSKNTKKLKIGFLSGDLKMHPIYFWLYGLLKHFSKDDFSINLYITNEQNPLSEMFREFSDSVNYVAQLSDVDLAKKIHQDEICILFDLSGHQQLGRLKTLSLKPAPIQISWMGNVGTTGIHEIDYVLADPFFIRDGEQIYYTEKLISTGDILPFPANDFSNLQINRSLARHDGTIVLGSINNAIKINQRVLESWMTVLSLVPQAILLISNPMVTSEFYKSHILSCAKDYCVSESRIIFDPLSNKDQYLKRFNKIDIALDPFPFTGSTTTNETLMMSVPLVTLETDSWGGRMSSYILNNSGLAELVTTTREDYIEKLVDLASSPMKIVNYKNIIHEKYTSSSITDTSTYAQGLTKLLQKLWLSHLDDLTKDLYKS